MSALAVLAIIYLIVGVLLVAMLVLIVLHAAFTCLSNAFFCALGDPLLRAACWLRGQGR